MWYQAVFTSLLRLRRVHSHVSNAWRCVAVAKGKLFGRGAIQASEEDVYWTMYQTTQLERVIAAGLHVCCHISSFAQHALMSSHYAELHAEV